MNIDGLVPAIEYENFMDKFPLCTVDVLIFDEKRRVLLFRRTNEPYKGDYFTPGGRLFKNETLVDCALRQLKNEVGITVDKDSLDFVGVVNEVNPDSIFPDVNYHSVNIVFSLLIESSIVSIKLDSQHSDFKWFDTSAPNINSLVVKKIEMAIEKSMTKYRKIAL